MLGADRHKHSRLKYPHSRTGFDSLARPGPPTETDQLNRR
jgi:hypothetical protein